MLLLQPFIYCLLYEIKLTILSPFFFKLGTFSFQSAAISAYCAVVYHGAQHRKHACLILDIGSKKAMWSCRMG